MDLNARVRVGQTSLSVPCVGVGTAPLGNMFEAHSEPAAALQFPFAHPRVCTVLLGIRTIDELEKNLGWLNVSIPDELWADLKSEGLVREDAPTPRSSRIESRQQ